MPSGRRGGRPNSYSVRHKRRLALFGMADAGRWALVRRPAAPSAERQAGGGDGSARAPARRWGVGFWKFVTREAGLAAPRGANFNGCRRLGGLREIRRARLGVG